MERCKVCRSERKRESYGWLYMQRDVNGEEASSAEERITKNGLEAAEGVRAQRYLDVVD